MTVRLLLTCCLLALPFMMTGCGTKGPLVQRIPPPHAQQAADKKATPAEPVTETEQKSATPDESSADKSKVNAEETGLQD